MAVLGQLGLDNDDFRNGEALRNVLILNILLVFPA